MASVDAVTIEVENPYESLTDATFLGALRSCFCEIDIWDQANSYRVCLEDSNTKAPKVVWYHYFYNNGGEGWAQFNEADIILFDTPGMEKSIEFPTGLITKLPKGKKFALAGSISEDNIKIMSKLFSNDSKDRSIRFCDQITKIKVVLESPILEKIITVGKTNLIQLLFKGY